MARSTCVRSYALGLLTFGLLTTTALVQTTAPAQAANLQANSSWTINRVASMASGSYCTMAQRYSDDTILTFAKNQSGEYSLAFDFLKPQFPDAKTTTVSLRPGNGSAQTFSVDPQNDKVIVIGIGADEKFISAVKSSNKIDLEANGKANTFSTEKFAAAADELSTCVSSMKPSMPMAKAAPIKPEETAVVAAAAAAVKPAAGAEEKAAAPAPAPVAPVAAKTTTASLAPQPSQPRETPRMISNPDVQQGRALSAEGNQVANLQVENAQLKQALAQARQSYEAAQNNSQVAMTSEIQEKYQALQKENEALKSQTMSAPDLSQELARIRAELTATKARNQDLEAQASQLNAQQKASIGATQQLTELQKQNGQMKVQLDTANQLVAQLTDKVNQTSSGADQLAELHKQTASMKMQLDVANQTIAQLKDAKSQTAASGEQIAMLQRQNAELKAQVAAANNNVTQLQSKASQSDASAQQIAMLQKQNADMKAQVEAANNNIAQLQAKTIQSASVGEQIASLQKQNAEMKAQVVTANNAVAELQTKLAQSANASQQVAMLQKQNADIKAQLDVASRSVGQSTAAAQQVAALQKQLEAANQTVAQLQVKIAQTPAVNPAANAALAENAALKQQIIQLQNAKAVPSDKAASNEAFNKLQAELNNAIAENAALKQQIDSVETAAGSDQASQIKVAGNNWDLEQATKRYQEAQREIRRLGAMVQKEQSLREQDKKDMEAKLFDPAITDQAQQEKIDALQQRIAQLEQGAPAAPQAAAAPLMPMAAPVPQVVKAPELEVASIAPAAGNPQDGREEIAPLIEDKKIAAEKPSFPVASAVITPAVSVNFPSQMDYARMLKTAGINIRGDVDAVSSSNADNYRAYRWKTDSLYGSAELRAMKGGKGFDEAVNEYLDRAKTRCGGDFAAVPSDVSVGADKAKAFEIACIGGKTDTSASVLFTYGNDVMTTLAHEGKSDAMDTAMEARDRMAAQMSSVKTAAK